MKKGKRKLTKKESIEKNVSWIIWTAVITLVLIISIFVVKQTVFGPTFEYKQYKVTKFTPQGTTAVFYDLRLPVQIYGSLDIYHVFLKNDPRSMDDIDVGENVRKVILDPKPSKIWLTNSPDLPDLPYVGIAMLQIAGVTGQNKIFRIPTTGAITREIEGMPESSDIAITCDDSSSLYEIVVIDFRYGNETKIFVDEAYWRCVIIQGTDKDEIIRAADKTILTLLGI